jgi:hypothetical protein
MTYYKRLATTSRGYDGCDGHDGRGDHYHGYHDCRDYRMEHVGQEDYLKDQSYCEYHLVYSILIHTYHHSNFQEEGRNCIHHHIEEEGGHIRDYFPISYHLIMRYCNIYRFITIYYLPSCAYCYYLAACLLQNQSMSLLLLHLKSLLIYRYDASI